MPNQKDIDSVADSIRENGLVQLLSFSDVLNRYVDILFLPDTSYRRVMNGALFVLIRAGGSLSPSQLAKLMLRSRHSITNFIDGLEKEGSVIREKNPVDRRGIQVKVTSAGLELAKDILGREVMDIREIMSCLDEKETQELYALLSRLRRKLVDVLETPQPG